jgi:ParB/RepB/Spo0J family partition protein
VSQKSLATNASERTARLTKGLAQTAAAASALLEEGDRRHAGISEDARDLLLDDIEPDPLQSRRTFEEADLRALAEDIARRGVISPVLVRPPLIPLGKYRLVCGERRWRASRMAGLVRIPTRVRDLRDDEVRAAQLAENILRADLNDIEKGRSLRELYDIRKEENSRTTWEAVAEEVGLGRARIHDLFHLASLPASISALIEAGRLSGSHGIALQRSQTQLGDEKIIQLALEAARPEGRRTGSFGLSVVALRERIQALQQGEPDTLELASSVRKSQRPFIQRTLQAIVAGQLKPEEYAELLRALESYQASGAEPTDMEENQ